jgi:kinesin family protein 18/19
VRPLADNFLSGINSTVFAYGITGAGKSFTMFGKKTEEYSYPGLIELVFEYLCQTCCDEDNVKLGLSYMEIYNEQVFDLLKQKSENLQIQDDPVLGVVVSDL